MSGPASRRGFLSGLASLPFIGGSVALIGTPRAVALPASPILLAEYQDWLIYEQAELAKEIHGAADPHASARWEAQFGHAFNWHRARGRYRPSHPSGEMLGDGLSFPSTRAALVMSTVGCGWGAW